MNQKVPQRKYYIISFSSTNLSQSKSELVALQKAKPRLIFTRRKISNVFFEEIQNMV